MSHPRRPERHSLPAAGHARTEELKRRHDMLDERGEQEFGTVNRIDPAKLRPDREILQHIDGFEVEDAQPGYIYCWVREEKPGAQVRQKCSQRILMPDGFYVNLWEVVQSDMPEASGERDARGYRKIGDTILLRARAERHRQYQLQQQHLQQQLERGSSSALEDLAARSRGMVKVYSETEMSAQKTTLDRAMQAGMARGKFTEKLRDGTAHQV